MTHPTYHYNLNQPPNLCPPDPHDLTFPHIPRQRDLVSNKSTPTLRPRHHHNLLLPFNTKNPFSSNLTRISLGYPTTPKPPLQS